MSALPPHPATSAEAPIDRELLTRAFGVLAVWAPARVRVADLQGRLLDVANDGGSADRASAPPTTLRELWERERPARPGASQRVPFLETPAMRAMAGVTVDRETYETFETFETGDAGARIVEASAVPIRDDGDRLVGVLLLDRDVTEQHRLQEALRDAERREATLQQQLDDLRDARLAALGRLAAGAMHDMNNALNPIMGAAFLLQHHAESPAAVREYAERIRAAAERGAALSARVARFVRQEPVHAGGDEAVDLSVLLAEVAHGFEPIVAARSRAARPVDLVLDTSPRVCTRGLPGEIRVALENVVRNALDSMPDGGTLSLRAALDGEHACVELRDNGTGMDAATRTHAYEPFFSTHRSGSAGLGLAEVWGIMRRHRGGVTIDSEPGRGTTVTLRFPLDSSAVVTAAPERRETEHGPLHVLVVEDDDDGRDFLRRVLNTAGHTVDSARTVAEAHARLAAAVTTSYHLLLTDVGLPDGSGWDLAAYVHSRWPAVRIGVITGWDSVAEGDREGGVEFVLHKPMRGAELLARIAGTRTSTTSQ